MMGKVQFFHALSGSALPLPFHVCCKVRDHSELEWYLQFVSEALQWPVDHLKFVVKDRNGEDRIVEYIHRISKRSHTRLLDLFLETDDCIHVSVQLLPPPSDYSNLRHCICDFGSCCTLCMVPGRYGCQGCGNTGCCRSGNCGHPCCEKADRGEILTQTSFCPYYGCRPW